MGLYLGDSTTGDKRYSIVITPQDTGAGRGRIEGGLTSTELSVKGGNSYESIASKASGLISAVDTGLSALKTLSDLKGASGAGMGSTPKLLTRQVWSGSDSPAFNVTMVFVCTDSVNPKQSVVSKVNAIMEYLYPRSTFNKKVFGQSTAILTAPAGYNPITRSGLVRLNIGTWFSAGNLIIETANFDYSKEMNRVGEPIYAIGQVMLKPFDAITYKEFKDYFKGGKL